MLALLVSASLSPAAAFADSADNAGAMSDSGMVEIAGSSQEDEGEREFDDQGADSVVQVPSTNEALDSGDGESDEVSQEDNSVEIDDVAMENDSSASVEDEPGPLVENSNGGGSLLAENQSTPSLRIEAHVQNRGWQKAVGEGHVAGTTGQGLNLEGLRVYLEGLAGSDLQIRAHVSSVGWQNWVGSGSVAGTVGQNLPIEALQIKLTGEAANTFDVWYRVHSADFGWGGWASNGASAGSQGYAKAAQAVEIRLVAKGKGAPGDTANAFRTYTIGYQAHVQNIGWQGRTVDGATAGTTGKNLTLEALTVPLGGGAGTGGVQVRAHVTNIGW